MSDEIWLEPKFGHQVLNKGELAPLYCDAVIWNGVEIGMSPHFVYEVHYRVPMRQIPPVIIKEIRRQIRERNQLAQAGDERVLQERLRPPLHGHRRSAHVR